MNINKALMCLFLACLPITAFAQTGGANNNLGNVYVSVPRPRNTINYEELSDILSRTQTTPFSTEAGPIGDGGGGDGALSCPDAKNMFRQSGCSINGDPESNPLNYNPNTYDSGTALNRALDWAKDTWTYQPAGNKFLGDLLRYEDQLNLYGGNPADWGQYLLNDLADDCLIQGAHSYDKSFDACVDAVKEMAAEVSSAINPVTKQGIIDKIAGALGKKLDGSGSVGGGPNTPYFSPSWAANYLSTTSSLTKHSALLMREHDCADMRSNVIAACGGGA